MQSKSLVSESWNILGSILVWDPEENKGVLSDPLSCCIIQDFQSFLHLYMLYLIYAYACTPYKRNYQNKIYALLTIYPTIFNFLNYFSYYLYFLLSLIDNLITIKMTYLQRLSVCSNVKFHTKTFWKSNFAYIRYL